MSLSVLSEYVALENTCVFRRAEDNSTELCIAGLHLKDFGSRHVVVLLVSSLMDYQVETKTVIIIMYNLLYCWSIAVVMLVTSLGYPVGTRKQVVD
jgi:hypothetical protein